MKKKSDIITFKVDDSLLEAMQGIPNRSNFIRSAIMAALDSSCPLCRGTGILTPNQRRHWDSFVETHSVQQCAECSEFHIVCSNHPAGRLHGKRVQH